MTVDPYSPPRAELMNPSSQSGSPIKALLIGLVVDIGGSILVGIAIAMVYTAILVSSGSSIAEVEVVMQDDSPTSVFNIVGTIAGCGCSILGGYVCARIARSVDYKLGWLLAASSNGVGLLLMGLPETLGYTALMVGLSVASVLLGTRLGLNRSPPGASA